MSYEPTVWKAGDTVTSAKLNKLEQGVAAGGNNDMVMMTMTANNNTITYTVNKTWQEIWDNNYTMVCIEIEEKRYFALIDYIDSSNFSISIITNQAENLLLFADNANDYPMDTLINSN